MRAVCPETGDTVVREVVLKGLVCVRRPHVELWLSIWSALCPQTIGFVWWTIYHRGHREHREITGTDKKAEAFLNAEVAEESKVLFYSVIALCRLCGETVVQLVGCIWRAVSQLFALRSDVSNCCLSWSCLFHPEQDCRR